MLNIILACISVALADQTLIGRWAHPLSEHIVASVESNGMSIVEKLPLVENLYVLQTVTALDKKQLKALAREVGALYLEPNQKISLDVPTDDTPEDPQQNSDFWWHDKLQTLKAQKAAGSLKDVIVAIVDTGIDLTHPALKNRLWANTDEIAGNGLDDDRNGFVDDNQGWDFFHNINNAQDDSGHGTHVAGLVGAQELAATKVFGVAPNARLMPIKVFNEFGQGDLITALKGAAYALRMGAQVLNLSFGVPNPSEAWEDLLATLPRYDAVAVAAAGNAKNNNDTRGEYPANSKFWWMISVAGTNAQDELMDISNYGPLSVTMSAPGENIVSTFLGGTTKSMTGTSFATPLVAGALALLKGANASKSFEELLARLFQSSNKLPALLSKVQGAGRLNLWQMIKDKKEDKSFPLPSQQWKTTATVIECEHPYRNDSRDLKTLTEKTAQWVRLPFTQIEIEDGYDYLEIKNGLGQSLANLSGHFRPGVELYIPITPSASDLDSSLASQLSFDLLTDGSGSEYGYKINSYMWGTL